MMQTKPGRNDPCWCGSGLKYKKCHLNEDTIQEREAALNPLPFPAEPTGDPGVDEAALMSSLQAMDDQRRSLMRLGLNGQLRRFETDLSSGALTDEVAFTLLDVIHDELIKRQERRRFRELVERLRAEAPAVFETSALWYYSIMVEDTLADRRYDELADLLPPIADLAGNHLDEINRLIEAMLFHDQLDAVLDLMDRALPLVQASDDVIPEALASFAARSSVLHLYRYLEQGGSPDLDSADLHESLSERGLLDQELLRAIGGRLLGTEASAWTLDDFVHDETPEDEEDDDEDEWNERDLDLNHIDFPTAEDYATYAKLQAAGQAAPVPDLLTIGDLTLDAEEEDDEEFEEGFTDSEFWSERDLTLRRNLLLLTIEWIGWLHRERGQSYARAELAREALIDYLLIMPTDEQRRPRLAPEKQSYEQTLLGLVSFFGGHFYQMGALFLLTPTFIDFLVEKGLLRRDRARGARKDVLSFRKQVQGLLDQATGDPVLVEAIKRAGE